LPISTLPAGHVPTAAELKTITDAISVVQNIATYTSTSISPTVNFTTTSYADFTGAAVSFTKLQTASLLSVSIALSGYMQTTQPRTELIAVNIGGTDYQVNQYLFNALNDHRAWSGTVVLSGIAAGSYTVQTRGKLNGTSATATHDTGDTISIVVQEIPQ
jgi:hypothetical protein